MRPSNACVCESRRPLLSLPRRRESRKLRPFAGPLLGAGVTESVSYDVIGDGQNVVTDMNALAAARAGEVESWAVMIRLQIEMR
jgi:hypothetical protein